MPLAGADRVFKDRNLTPLQNEDPNDDQPDRETEEEAEEPVAYADQGRPRLG